MADVKINRESNLDESLALTASASTTGRIDLRRFGGAGIIVTALATGVSINWHVAKSDTDTAVPLHADGAALSTAIAVTRAYAIPDAAFAFPFVVPVLNAGTATVDVCKKG